MAMYSGSISPEFFPRATLYTSVPAADTLHVRDRRPTADFPYSERHLQCAWYDDKLRPANLKTAGGETVTVEHPGTWNLEAGPDFLGAAIRLGPKTRRIEGDVEVHIHPSDWRRHGHDKDRNYSRVRVHVTFFPGRVVRDEFPPGTVHIALRDLFAGNPAFSFETIDVTAYPYAIRASATPCRKQLKHWQPAERGALLDAAGEERLRRKGERMAAAMRANEPAQVLYEEIMTALGYKHNKEAFRRLARTVPLETLRDTADGDPDIAYSLLMGVAGLLPRKLDRSWDTQTRQFVRTLWDAWWRMHEPWDELILPRGSWKLGGLRPANHPARRLMAAADLFTRGTTPDERILHIGEHHADEFVKQAYHLLENLCSTYWDRRHSLGGKKTKRPVALVGRSRAAGIVTNVMVPFLAAMDEATPFSAGFLQQLPVETENAVQRQTAHTLFGRDHNPAFYHDGLRRQGLLQIFHDFCLNDRSHCTQCSFPELLKAYRPDLPTP
jgi:hypothetical protein